MELIYFWIDGYKNLKNCGICLNSDYKCENLEYLKGNLNINIENSSNLNNIFDKMFNITTIVGKNGSGKSNIVNALSYTLREIKLVSSQFNNLHYDKSNLENSKLVLLFSDYNAEKTQKSLFYYAKNVTVNFSNKKLIFKDIMKLKENPRTVKMIPKLPYSVAKFQPFLRISDDNNLDFPLKKNIFGTTKIKLKEYFYYDRFRLYDTVRNLLELYKFEKYLKRIAGNGLKIFLEENQHLFFDLYSPYLDLYDTLQWANNRVQQNKEDNYKITQIVSRSVSTLSSYIRRKKYTKVGDLFSTVLPNLFFTYALGEIITILNKSNGNLKKKLTEIINALPKDTFPKQNDRVEFYSNISKVIITHNNVRKMLNFYIDFETKEELKNTLKNKFEVLQNSNKTVLQLKKVNMIKLEDYPKIPNDIKQIEELKGISKNLYRKERRKVFDFMSLSTGEQRIIRFMADLYLVANLQKIDTNTKFYTDVYIFDEMDLSWHPEWQRKMVFYVLDILKKVSTEKNRKMNIIFTTHSPFILSDMPQDNVVILEKDSKGITIPKNPINNTFATNIHELFKESFFMESTMGEFAKNQIKRFINEIDKIEDKESFEILERKINMIGEPIIRIQLLKELYNKKYIECCIDDEKELCKQLKLENNKLKRENIQLKRNNNETN